MTLAPLGDCAVVVTVGATADEAMLAQTHAIADAIGRNPPAGVTDIVPAFATVTVHYDPAKIAGFEILCAAIEQQAGAAKKTSSLRRARVVEVPVCYGQEFGPDLGEIAARSGLASEEVVALHAGGNYFVQAVGFAPGFAYLGGLAEKIRTPRRATPRTRIPAGSVGIGGEFTGIYPFASPGGWNLVGRTPLKMFDPFRAEPAILRAGDRVQFRAITAEEFARWK